ncbi:methyltransferase domain-containing protein [Geodermatophilus sp. SYSU D00700]
MAPHQYARWFVPRPVRRAVARARFGDLRRTAALSAWGDERGTPVDRWYIERFLRAHEDDVRGHALEVKADQYASRLGAKSVDIVDIDEDNPRATVVGDLCVSSTLQPGTYDVAVVTQTLQLVSEPLEAVRNLLASLRPGGRLLITVPTLSRIVDRTDRWRWTPSGMQELLTHVAPAQSEVESTGLGNGLTARAFLFGLAVEDLNKDVLNQDDEFYPMVVGARVRI